MIKGNVLDSVRNCQALFSVRMFIQYQGLSSQAKRLIDNEITLSGRNIETGSGRSARPPCNTSILIISQNPTITSAKVQTYKIFWLPAKNVRTNCGLTEQIYHNERETEREVRTCGCRDFPLGSGNFAYRERDKTTRVLLFALGIATFSIR